MNIADEYNIAWENYTDHLKQMLHELKEDVNSQDVTLVCGDKRKLKAHKVVLVDI